MFSTQARTATAGESAAHVLPGRTGLAESPNIPAEEDVLRSRRARRPAGPIPTVTGSANDLGDAVTRRIVVGMQRNRSPRCVPIRHGRGLIFSVGYVAMAREKKTAAGF